MRGAIELEFDMASVAVKLPTVIREKCGTTAGYQAHRYYKEIQCQPCRDADNVRSAQRYAANPEKKKASSAKYQSENPEKVKARHTKYYADNIEKAKVRSARII